MPLEDFARKITGERDEYRSCISDVQKTGVRASALTIYSYVTRVMFTTSTSLFVIAIHVIIFEHDLIASYVATHAMLFQIKNDEWYNKNYSLFWM